MSQMHEKFMIFSGGKLVFTLAALLCADVVCFAGDNLLFNPDMSMSDGMGEIAGWSRDNNGGSRKPLDWDPGFATVTASRGEIAFVFSCPELRVVRQKYFHLTPGGKFRLSAEARTSGLNGGRAYLELRTDKGVETITKVNLPENTSGEWRKIEKVFTTPTEWTAGHPSIKDERHFIFQICGAMQGTDVARAVKFSLRGLRLEPIDEIARNGSHPIDPRYVAPLPLRIVPIDPLLSKVSAPDAQMLFYWPGEPEGGVAACTLSAKVDRGENVVSARLGTDGRALLKFGCLSPGDHNIALSVVDAVGKVLATNSYLFTAVPPPPEGPRGTRLNNFVTRLHDGPLAEDDVHFFVPEDGWVWMSITGAAEAEATGTLDGADAPCVLRRKDEPFNEAQRFLPAGWHVLKVAHAAKGGRLRVHAVKTLVTNAPVLTEGASRLAPGLALTLPFHRRFGSLSTFNVLNGIALTSPFKSLFEKRGLRFWGGTRGAAVWKPQRFERADMAPCVESDAWKGGMDVIVDENPVDVAYEWGTPLIRRNISIYSEIVWDMRSRKPHGGAVNTYYSESNYGAHFRDRKCYTSEISAIVNSGDGRGLVVPESYAPSFADESLSALWEGYFAKFLTRTIEYVPAAKGRVLFWLAPYIDLGFWSSYGSPEVDIKAHYARLIRAFAVMPGLADAGGIGFGAASSADDDIRRWGYRLIRHYCLEGATDDLAAQYGFKWMPGLVKNCDFAKGLEDWTAIGGEGGKVAAEKIKGYGRRHGRQNLVFPSLMGLGDGVAVFASGATPNRLEQKLSGLVPGKHYTLDYSVADYDSAVNGFSGNGKRPPPAKFSARLSGATEVKVLAYRRAGGGRKNYPCLTNFHYVFRADGAECTLTLMDCDADGQMFAAGTKQVVNHIVFKPYYLETPDEIREIVALFTSEDKTKEKAK